MSTTNPYDPAAYVAGGSGWSGQMIDLLALAQQAALSREELAFRRWAAEKGFEIDEKNRQWLEEQFYQDQEFQRQQSLGYMQSTPFNQQVQSRSYSGSGGYYVNADAPELADEMAARRAIWDNKGNVRKLWKGKVAPTDEQVYDMVGRWLKNEAKGSDAMSYAIDKGWGRPVGYSATATGVGGAGGAGGVPEDWIKTLEREVAEWNRELQQQGLGLNYLNMLSSLRGPADWVQYANTVRAAEGSQLPAWAQSLVQGQNIPQFQGAGDGGYQSIWNQPAQSAQAALGQQPVGGAGGGNQGTDMYYGGPAQFSAGVVPGQQVAAGAVPGQQAAMPNWAQQLAQNPQSIRYSQWNAMLPFEQQMLGGALENEGQDFGTWVQQMQRSWVPRQQVTPITSWQ